MDELGTLIAAAKKGDAESLRRVLLEVQRPLRLTAAIFLPTLDEVDATLAVLARIVVTRLAEVPADAPVLWMRRQLRQLIHERMSTGAKPTDVLLALVRQAGVERLASVPVDADPVTALNGRLRWLSKGATDLLILRFANRLSLERMAAQRALSINDLCDALQTACRQLDWTGDTGGERVDAELYRAIDALVCPDTDPYPMTAEMGERLRQDPGLSLRIARAARLHLVAAAWHAPELRIDPAVLVRPRPAPPAVPPPAAPAPVPTRRPTNPQVPARLNRPRSVSTPTRRQLAQRGDDGRDAPSLEEYPERKTSSGLITTLIGVALALSGVALLLLRNGSGEVATASPVVAPPPLQEVVATPEPASTSEKPAVPPTGPVTPVVAPKNTPTAKALFIPETMPMPLAAWSTRRVVDAYTGPLMRVRRSGDLAEKDIGFAGDGSLDAATLTAFTSRSSAHVMVWYDQSGNQNHLQQSERERQPRIVSDGALEVENSRPVITFDRTRFQHLTTPAAIPLGCLYAVVEVRSYGDGAQGLFGSPTRDAGNLDAYYPIVDRDRTGECEWWVGQQDNSYNIIRKTIPRDRLLLWQSSSDGQKKPKLVLRLDGKEVGAVRCDKEALVPVGPTTVGCLYWSHMPADPFGGSLGEMFVLPPGSSRETRGAIYKDLKTWWKTP